MPCPKCNAPEIKNAQSNYCFNCGTLLNPAMAGTETPASKVIVMFVILLGLHLFQRIFYLSMPLIMQRIGGFEVMDEIYGFIGLFFGLCEVTIIILAGVYVKQRHFRVIFIIMACINFIFTMYYLISRFIN